jgi:hypothetical protein
MNICGQRRCNKSYTYQKKEEEDSLDPLYEIVTLPLSVAVKSNYEDQN